MDEENNSVFLEKSTFRATIFKIFRIKLVLALSNSLTYMKVMIKVWLLFYGRE